jgi:hypothetical protein
LRLLPLSSSAIAFADGELKHASLSIERQNSTPLYDCNLFDAGLLTALPARDATKKPPLTAKFDPKKMK